MNTKRLNKIIEWFIYILGYALILNIVSFTTSPKKIKQLVKLTPTM